ncbi:GSCFA domain-containing protein [Roseivirga thermotolerans]|uniref:GSCFA domain-containing protein n=1 Tax=Roseivirga thermotolerans TaxID=1758176 RepID=UPI00273F3591|nr:GSCFA domain-containing protein [Roseivirga thermotolerans]
MFRTEIEELKSRLKIGYSSPLLTVGSCFSDSIGQRLEAAKFEVMVNPLGTIFNPLSIFELLELALERTEVLEQATLKRDGVYLNYKFHSSFSAKTKATLHKRMDDALNKVYEQINKASVLFITLGTAWVYEQKKTRMLVTNCHKTPQKEFEKKLLSSEEIVSAFFSLKELIHQYNPTIEFVLTVSPVRHTRDTLPFNSASKSVLRLAAHYITEMADDVHYFPAYEIMMDDLRDYRFYEKDMIHPNEQAIDYIWQKFASAYIHPKDLELMEQWEKVRQNLNHRPFNPKSAGHQKFLHNTLQQLKSLSHTLSLGEEIAQIKKQIQ